MSEEIEEGQDGYILNEVNASGDAYLVRTIEGESHPFIYHCFPPSVALPEKLKKGLKNYQPNNKGAGNNEFLLKHHFFREI